MNIRIQAKAKADLRGIWRYSRTEWGADKADAYLFDLENAMNLIADHPEIGFACGYIRKGYRQYAAGKHMIFYKILSDHISVIRILHESMDYKQNMQ